jgi:hypothetical protein
MKKLFLCVLALLAFAASGMAQTLPSYVPANGLVGWWPFNGNANDESGNGNNGTPTNVQFTPDRFGTSNSSARFPDGNTNSNILFGNHHYPTFSYSFWYKISIPTTNGFGVLASNYSNTKGFEIQLGGGNKLTFILSNGASWGSFLDTTEIELNKWSHIAVTFNGQFGKMYKNGNLVLNGLNTGTLTELDSLFEPNFQPGNQILTFGDRTNATGFEFNYEGFLDDFAIYNRALTQQEITGLYQGANTTANCPTFPASLAQGLVGYWPFCGNALDESGNNNHGTVNGATLTTDRFGNAGSAYGFDGIDDYIRMTSNSVLGTKSRTISFWMNTLGIISGQQEVLIDEGGNTCGSGFAVVKDSNPSKLKLDVGCSFVYNNDSIGRNRWNHVVVVYDSLISSNLSGISFYVNSSKILNLSSTIGSLNINSGAEQKLTFGKSRIPSDGFYYFGSIDDIAIWNRALTPQEIKQLYNQGICQTSITVTDTLLIHTGITSYNPVAYGNTLKVWPNPGNTAITLDAGNLALMQGWKIRISNSLGQEVFPATLISQQQQVLSMSTWGGNGLYLLHLINPQGHITEVKKIVLAP